MGRALRRRAAAAATGADEALEQPLTDVGAAVAEGPKAAGEDFLDDKDGGGGRQGGRRRGGRSASTQWSR